MHAGSFELVVATWPAARWQLREGLEGAGWVAGADEAVGVGDLEGGVGEELGVPAGLVELLVMSPAEQDEVVEAGGAAA